VAFIVNQYLIYPDTYFLFAFVSFIKIALGLAILSNALVNDDLSKILRISMGVIALAIIMFPF